jgi:predicted permease
VLRRIVPGREGEIIAGDLREEYRARGGGRLWYWRHVASGVAVRISPHRMAVAGFGQDLHYMVRVLRRNPGYALAAMMCLALGIAVNTSVAGIVDELFVRKLQVPDAERVVSIVRAGDLMTCSYRDWEAFRRRSGGVLAGLTGVNDAETAADTEGRSETIIAQVVAWNFAEVLGVRPVLGRWFTPGDAELGSEPVVVLSDHAWAQRFARSPSVVGKRVRIETEWYRVVGVAPRDFRGVSTPLAPELWLPFPAMPIHRELLSNPRERERPRVRLVGRLRPGVTVARAEAVLRQIDAEIRREFPRPRDRRNPLQVSVMAGAAQPDVRRTALPVTVLLLGVTGIVLAIASVNVANLLLSRAAVRRREMALRQALGASRWRLVRQTMAESLALAAGGAVLGALFAQWSNALLLRSLAAIPEAHTLALVPAGWNWRMAGFAAAASLVSAVLFTVSPALEQSRCELAAALKGAELRRMRQRDVYVVAQVALSMVLLVGAALLLRAMRQAYEIAPGFAMDHRLSARIYISEPEYTDEAGQVFFRRTLADVSAIPGVRGAALSYTVPLGAMANRGCAMHPGGYAVQGGSNVVTPGYFAVMGIPLVSGRDFDFSDRAQSPRVVIVNEMMARQFWPGEDPLGKMVRLNCDAKDARPVRVIGVARDSKYHFLDEAPQIFYYTPLTQDFIGFMALTVHTAGEPAAWEAPLRATLRGLDPNLRIYDVATLDDTAALSLWKVRWQATLIGAFGLLAIVLAAVGLYGVVAYAVAQRTREIGIRMALGAQKADVLWMVLGRGLRLTGIGIAIGVMLSAGASRLLRAFLFGVSPLDGVAFAGAALFWIATAMIASYLPARRAARVDPLSALRWE